MLYDSSISKQCTGYLQLHSIQDAHLHIFIVLAVSISAVDYKPDHFLKVSYIYLTYCSKYSNSQCNSDPRMCDTFRKLLELSYT